MTDRTPVPLTDDRIDAIAELVIKGMPDGIRGFCNTWGWRQFARALLQDCAGYYGVATATVAALDNQAERAVAGCEALAERVRVLQAALAAISLIEAETSSAAHEKIRQAGRIAREALNG